jgi:hypothetical protein
MVWTPRSLQERKKSDETITITDTTIEQITEVQKGQEVQLTVLVEKKVTEVVETKKIKDTIRKNHYATKNKNVVSIPFSGEYIDLTATEHYHHRCDPDNRQARRI